MADLSSVGVASNPYAGSTFTAAMTDKNTLSMSDYFQLMAVQLQNQDMTNPMDSGDMMAQMVPMGMMQAMTTMTEAIDNSTAVSTQTYAASMIGQEITVAVTEKDAAGRETPVGVKYGKVVSVDFTSGMPTIRLENDPKDYSMSYILGVGKLDDPYKEPDTDGKDDEEDSGNKDDTGTEKV